MTSSETTLRLVIHGRVQGVFFRDSMRREAYKLEVSGWVRNRGDGTVEAVVQGDAANVKAIVSWAHNGPRHAIVDKVDLESADGEFTGFEIL
jgi:acylphosphatase